MGQTVTLELPDEIVWRARDEAHRSHRSLEDVVVGWLDWLASDAPVETLPDAQVLALSEMTMADADQAELSALLARNAEGALSKVEHERLDALMDVYRDGLVRKARALQVAVKRGLRAPLS